MNGLHNLENKVTILMPVSVERKGGKIKRKLSISVLKKSPCSLVFSTLIVRCFCAHLALLRGLLLLCLELIFTLLLSYCTLYCCRCCCDSGFLRFSAWPALSGLMLSLVPSPSCRGLCSYSLLHLMHSPTWSSWSEKCAYQFHLTCPSCSGFSSQSLLRLSCSSA